MMNKDFLELPWHDAELVLLSIDRSNPGNLDEVVMKVVWPDDSRSTLRFKDCYWVSLDMNMGMITSESILYAERASESETLSSVTESWKRMGANLEQVNHFILVTNSTNSRIEIICKYFENIADSLENKNS